MPKRSSKTAKKSRPKQKDTQQLARSVLDAVAPEAESQKAEKKKNPAAVMLGRLGGLKGGKARAEALSKKRRSEIASRAAQARWKREEEAE